MSHPLFILGVDPGLGGGFGVYDWCHPELSSVFDMPLTRDGKLATCMLAHTIEDLGFASDLSVSRSVVAVVENVHSRPHQAGAFNFGLSTGVIHGILAANRIPFTLVAPSVWKVKMGLGRGEGETQADTKDRARAMATQLFPHLANEFKLKKHDGRAEALLLALYHHHTLIGGR